MIIKIGNEVPNTQIFRMVEGKIQKFFLHDLILKKKIILLGMPGAFTPTCSEEHLPNYINNISNFHSKGIEVICLIVNDLYIAELWEKESGARKSGLKIYSDPKSHFAKKTGLIFSAPEIGFVNRLQRFVMLIDDRIIKFINTEEKRGICDLTLSENTLKVLT